MKKLLQDLNSLYEREITKDLYTYILSGITTVLLTIIPFFIPMRKILGSFVFDLCARLFITYTFCSMFYFVSHLEQFYEKFYSGVNKANTPKPDGIKQTINIFAAIFVGCCGYIFYHLSLDTFFPMTEGLSIAISLSFGIILSIPLLSQYNKR